MPSFHSHFVSHSHSLGKPYHLHTSTPINLRIDSNTACENMSNTKIITNVPLDSIGSSISIPDTSVDLWRNPDDGDSFIGTASHSHGLGWIESVIKPLQSIDSHGQDPSCGAGSYAITLPPTTVVLPASRSFKRKPGVGWYCGLDTESMVCTVSDGIGKDGTASGEAPRTQLCQVERILHLNATFAEILEDETPTQSPYQTPTQSPRETPTPSLPESRGASVRTCV